MCGQNHTASAMQSEVQPIFLVWLERPLARALGGEREDEKMGLWVGDGTNLEHAHEPSESGHYDYGYSRGVRSSFWRWLGKRNIVVVGVPIMQTTRGNGAHNAAMLVP